MYSPPTGSRAAEGLSPDNTPIDTTEIYSTNLVAQAMKALDIGYVNSSFRSWKLRPVRLERNSPFQFTLSVRWSTMPGTSVDRTAEYDKLLMKYIEDRTLYEHALIPLQDLGEQLPHLHLLEELELILQVLEAQARRGGL